MSRNRCSLLAKAEPRSSNRIPCVLNTQRIDQRSINQPRTCDGIGIISIESELRAGDSECNQACLALVGFVVVFI